METLYRFTNRFIISLESVWSPRQHPHTLHFHILIPILQHCMHWNKLSPPKIGTHDIKKVLRIFAKNKLPVDEDFAAKHPNTFRRLVNLLIFGAFNMVEVHSYIISCSCHVSPSAPITQYQQLSVAHMRPTQPNCCHFSLHCWGKICNLKYLWGGGSERGGEGAGDSELESFPTLQWCCPLLAEYLHYS